MNSAGPSSKPANLGGSIVLAVDYYTSNSLMEKMCGSSSWKKGDEITVYILLQTFRQSNSNDLVCTTPNFFLDEKKNKEIIWAPAYLFQLNTNQGYKHYPKKQNWPVY